MATENIAPLLLLRRQDIEQRTGLARSTIYKMISAGEFTQPIRVFGNAVGWPSNEVQAIMKARIAGKTEKEIKELVSTLHAERSTQAIQ